MRCFGGQRGLRRVRRFGGQRRVGRGRVITTARKRIMVILATAGGTLRNQGTIHLPIGKGDSRIGCQNGAFHADAAHAKGERITEIPHHVAARTTVQEDAKILHPVVGTADVNQHITAVGNVDGKRIGIIQRRATDAKDINIGATAVEGDAPVGNHCASGGRIAGKVITTALQKCELTRKIFHPALMQGTAEGDTGDIGIVYIDTIAIVDLTVGIGQVIPDHQNVLSPPFCRVERNAHPIILQVDITPRRQASFGVAIAGSEVIAYKNVILYGFTQWTFG